MKKNIDEHADEKGFRRIQVIETTEDGFKYGTFVGLVNLQGEEIVPCKYHNILGFYHNNPLACVKLNKKWGYINDKGHEVVPCQFDFAEDMFYCGLATVNKEDKWGCIDATGKLVIPVVYDDSILFCDNLAGTKRNGKSGVIDIKGNVVVDFLYDYCSVMGQNRICVKLNGKYGLINYYGRTITPCVYDGISDIKTGNRIEYQKGAEHGFMDLDGYTIQILPF